MSKTIQLSIEPVNGQTYVDGFHLGTNLKQAKQLAAERFKANAKNWRTIALMCEGESLVFGDLDTTQEDGIEWTHKPKTIYEKGFSY